MINLDGKKTIILAVLTIIYALAGLAIGKVGFEVALALVLGSLQVLGLRDALRKLE